MTQEREPQQEVAEMRHSGWLIVVSSVYHRTGEEGATEPVDARYKVGLQTDEQPYLRTTSAGEAWQPVDMGWIKAASLISIENRSRDTELELGIDLDVNTGRHHTEPGGGIVLTEVIPPGADARRWLPNGCRLVIRARKDTVKYNLTAFPD